MSLTDRLDEVFPTSFEFKLRKKDEYSVEAVLGRYFVYRYNKDRKILKYQIQQMKLLSTGNKKHFMKS